MEYYQNKIQRSLNFIKIDHIEINFIGSILNSIVPDTIITLPKIFSIYIENGDLNQPLKEIIMPCSMFNIHFNSFYRLNGIIVTKNYCTLLIIYHKETDHWYEICDKNSILINQPI